MPVFQRYDFKKGALGFTLSELLISLAILGVIATFVIPKVLQAQQDDRKRTVFKEVISALAVVEDQNIKAITDNDAFVVSPTADNGAFGSFYEKINCVKYCSSNPVTGGCWWGGLPADEDFLGVTYPNFVTGCIMHNGASMIGSGASYAHAFGAPSVRKARGNEVAIDWNGQTAPNTLGDDIMLLRFCLAEIGAGECTSRFGVGVRRHGPPVGTTSETLYNWVFE